MLNARALDFALVEQSDVAPFVPGNGVVIRFAYGPFIRPIAFPFRRNPWSEWRWATVRIAFVVLPFISLRIWRRDGTYFGAYIGGKVYQVDSASGHTYSRPQELGRRFATISGSFRWRHKGG